MSTYRKKLIEISLPLTEINDAGSYDKMPGIGAHPKNMHWWWARLPLPVARAVLFASLVDDPSCDPRFTDDPEAQAKERVRLFGIIHDLCSKNREVYQKALSVARSEIERSCGRELPVLWDPFTGGGSIPLEGSRLGLLAVGTDLNPVPVLITKAQIEIPPKYSGCRPIHPGLQESPSYQGAWQGATGLVADVRKYGEWVGTEAQWRIGHLYPEVKLPDGSRVPVLTYIWTRSTKCLNPACGAEMPLVRSFWLSKKKGNEAWVETNRDGSPGKVAYSVRTGAGKPREGTISRKGGVCVNCTTPKPLGDIQIEGKKDGFHTHLMAVVAEGTRRRIYVSPTEEQAQIALQAKPNWTPEASIVPNSRHMTPVIYGFDSFKKLFTPRQLVAMETFSDLIREVRPRVKSDYLQAHPEATHQERDDYANAVVTYLAMAVGRLADFNCAFSRWKASGEQHMQLFARQAISHVWDFAETNPFAPKGITWANMVKIVTEGLLVTPVEGQVKGRSFQQDAATLNPNGESLIVSTDPPYYDNVPYADLSDFFYIWMRRTLGDVYPDLFGTMLTPKNAELVADPFRHGGDTAAQTHFEEGFRDVFGKIRKSLDPRFPMTLYYAFKQAEEEDTEGDASAEGATAQSSTGWETILQALIDKDFQITATWPVRAAQNWRMRSMNSNAVASYIVLACRPRPETAHTVTRRELQSQLRSELPAALRNLQLGNIAPVDLAQAAIGPGMAIFSSCKQVLEAGGKPMNVRTALQMINQILDEVMTEQEGWYDESTRWAVAWYTQNGFDEAEYGRAETLAVAKNVSIRGLEDTGILISSRGKVRLLGRDDLPKDYDPAKDRRVTIWEMTQYLVRALETQGIEAAGRLLYCFRDAHPDADPERAKAMAYRLYAIADGKKRSAEARPYNGLILS